MPDNGSKAVSKGAERIEVTVRHATNGLEMKVVLPANAKFKHVKLAMARRLESDEAITRGQLITSTGGIYNAYKDNQRIGDVREVLVLCVDMEPPDDGPMEATLDGDDLTDEEAAVNTPATASSKSTIFNRDRAIALQSELLQGFKAADFQEKLAALESKHSSMASEAQFVKERQELFLSVQSVVLPAYGFEGSQSGVYKMMGSMGPFVSDPEFVKLANDINRVIGISSPQDTWASLSKSCRKVEDAPREPGRVRHRPPVRARGLPGLLGGGLGGLGGLGGGFGTFAAPAPMPLPGTAPAAGSNGSAKTAPSTSAAGPAGAAPGSKGSAKTAPSTGATGPAGAAPGGVREPRSGARQPPTDRGAPAPPPPEPAPGADEEEAPLFEPWPPGRAPSFKLFVAGSWNDYKPLQMQWQEGMFACPITLGSEGCETFQLLLDGAWDRTYYPSMPDASALEEHTVCGPDNKGHGCNWLIGKFVEEEARPRSRFVIIAGVDKGGAVRLVSWQPVG